MGTIQSYCICFCRCRIKKNFNVRTSHFSFFPRNEHMGMTYGKNFEETLKKIMRKFSLPQMFFREFPATLKALSKWFLIYNTLFHKYLINFEILKSSHSQFHKGAVRACRNFIEKQLQRNSFSVLFWREVYKCDKKPVQIYFSVYFHTIQGQLFLRTPLNITSPEADPG